MAEDTPSREEELRSLIVRLESLEQVLRTHTERLYKIEQRVGLDFRPVEQLREPARRRPLYETFTDERNESSAPAQEQPLMPHESVASDAPPPDGRDAQTRDVRQEPRPGHTTPPFAHGSSRSTTDAAGEGQSSKRRSSRDDVFASNINGEGKPRTAPAMRARDMETMIGGSWFNWLGIIAVTLTVAFFLKYAFDNQWVNPAMRVTLGAGAGFAILALAERLRAKGLRQYASVLSGGGVLILYLSTYAARVFYDLIGQTSAFMLMSAVTALAVALAVRHDARAIAILALIGGFSTPVLLSTGVDHQIAFFTYLAFLDAGVLALAYFKRWRILNFLSFFATVAMFVGWASQHYVAHKLWPTIFFLTLFFVLFSAIAPVHNILKQRPARWPDILLVIVNATFYFCATYVHLKDAGYNRPLGSFALMVSVFYILLFYLVWEKHRADALLRYSYAGAAVTFFTTAVAIQLDFHWVTTAWATEALMLTWVGLRAKEPSARHAALVVFSVALMHWFGWDVAEAGLQTGAVFTPLLNARAFSCAVLVGALLGAARLYQSAGEATEESERKAITSLYMLASAGLVFVLLTLDVNDYFSQRIARSPEGDAEKFAALEGARQFSLSALWIFYGAIVLSFGLLRRMRLLRYSALLLLGFTALKLITVDASYHDAPWHAPFFNLTFLAFMLMTAALAACAHLYARGDYAPAEESEIVRPALVLLAHLLAVVALSAEASGYFERMILETRAEGERLRELRLAESLSLSVVWALYGGAMLAYGYIRRNKLLRVMALVMLSLTTVKVFFWDLAALEKIYRIISFGVLGLILLAVSYLYQKKQRADDSSTQSH